MLSFWSCLGTSKYRFLLLAIFKNDFAYDGDADKHATYVPLAGLAEMMDRTQSSSWRMKSNNLRKTIYKYK